MFIILRYIFFWSVGNCARAESQSGVVMNVSSFKVCGNCMPGAQAVKGILARQIA